MMRNLYKKLMGKPLPVQNPMTEWEYQSCLGEVHSVVTCMLCKCGLFLSDDGDSKSIQQIIANDKAFLCKITVYNRDDACRCISGKEGKKTARETLRKISHNITE